MQITIDLPLPTDLEKEIRLGSANVNADAREIYAVGLYRGGKLTHFQLSKALGIDRFQTDGVLKKHGVMMEMSGEEFANELADLRSLITK